MKRERLERIPLRQNATGQGLILVTLALTALGTVMVYSIAGTSRQNAAETDTSRQSAAETGGRVSNPPWYEQTHLRQPIFAAAAMAMLCLLWRADYSLLARRPWPGRRWLGRIPSPAVILLVLAIAAAVVVLIPGAGHAVGGRRRWIRLGPVGFQPSEALKIAVLVCLAAILGRRDAPVRSFRRGFLPAALLVGVSTGLVITQDYGTAAIIGVGAAVVMLAGGVRLVHMAGLVPLCAAGFYFLVVGVPHRWARIQAIWNPSDLSNPSTYQPRQALIAIGSGASPAGLGGGAAKYGYLPESTTDFIFANICEELGMLGAMLVVGLLLVWLCLACRAAVRAPNRFGYLLAGGLGFVIAFQSALHIAVNVGLAPPTGVPLPFVSAGGSSLLLTSAATAMIVSVTSRRTSL